MNCSRRFSALTYNNNKQIRRELLTAVRGGFGFS
jgi:hypothetical protein